MLVYQRVPETNPSKLAGTTGATPFSHIFTEGLCPVAGTAQGGDCRSIIDKASNETQQKLLGKTWKNYEKPMLPILVI